MAKQGNRENMPQVARWLDQKREQWGKQYVDDLVVRAVNAKEPGLFYAMENGYVLGTPFPVEHALMEWQVKAMRLGTSFAVFMLEPEVANGTN